MFWYDKSENGCRGGPSGVSGVGPLPAVAIAFIASSTFALARMLSSVLSERRARILGYTPGKRKEDVPMKVNLLLVSVSAIEAMVAIGTGVAAGLLTAHLYNPQSVMVS